MFILLSVLLFKSPRYYVVDAPTQFWCTLIIAIQDCDSWAPTIHPRRITHQATGMVL